MLKFKTGWVNSVRVQVWDGKEFFPSIKRVVKWYNILVAVIKERRNKP